jgi:hypothetical protein
MSNTVLIEVESGSKTPEPAAARGRRRLEGQPGFGATEYSATLEFRVAAESCFASIARGWLAREPQPVVRKCKLPAARVRALSPRRQQSLATPASNARVPSAVVLQPSSPPRQLDAAITCEVARRERGRRRGFHLLLGAAANGSATCDV